MARKIKIDEEILNYAVFGGCILGGGGGGSRKLGMESGKAALKYGNLELIDINDIPEDTIIITASAVGAPAASLQYVLPEYHIRTIKLFEENTGIKIGGIITNENGGASTMNGWTEAVALDIPFIDAPCNGRAHPTGVMGSMNLNNVEGYVSCQAAVGGNPEINKYLETFIRGSIGNASGMVRQASVFAGGLVCVARNSVTAGYVKKNGALDGVSHAIETGRVFYKGLKQNVESAPESAAEFLKGEVVIEGKVDEIILNTTGGFDVGVVKVKDYEITFWNEYMTLEKNGERLATFPDLIMTFDSITGMPVTSAEIKQNQVVKIMKTSKKNLKLGSGMKDKSLLEQAGKIINKDILNYI
ncbi:DUF917 domain-containing protein [Clostridium autoethanogenum]|uniref:DUF917 family protein n=1 Tax=Clostridium autoethanogenum DSM 10061 TaxID=1341692 RepID=A0ABN4BFC5_9CLOT|nr:DUF917 family protein [Clostridium autoethanogenum]AGY74513.1 DUF917 family protein [Clostridium autoethanogenum DSM 10061]ALU34700.1 hypothetical protein CLAU_0271 [Clostridium autoethanogenum DSM 10061]OVY51419.1 hypothetical protein WX72_01552 [Clostridium autoethanogenum]DAD54300.1 TPA_exp: hypothetical protein CAETHG_RS01330 [Clostridium autoethanogenum DSM 10061]